MEQTLRAHLFALRDAYCASTGASVSTVAQGACGDWRFFDKVGEAPGASFRIRTYDRARHWFSARWPDGVAWPAGIPRPVSDDGAVESKLSPISTGIPNVVSPAGA